MKEKIANTNDKMLAIFFIKKSNLSSSIFI